MWITSSFWAFIYFLSIVSFIWGCCIFVATRAFSLVAASQGPSLVSMLWLLIAEQTLDLQTSVAAASGLSSYGSQGSTGSAVAAHRRLVAPWRVGSSCIRDWIRVSRIGKWILYHWATRAAQATLLLGGKARFQNQEYRLTHGYIHKQTVRLGRNLI